LKKSQSGTLYAWGWVWNVRVGRKHHAPYGVFEEITIFDARAMVGKRRND
jgi:hypothetical protein